MLLQWSLMKVISYIIILLLVIVGVSFAVLNAEYVTLNYYVGKIQLSLSLLLILTLALGVVIGMLGWLKAWVTLKYQNRTLRTHLKNAEKEIESLRTRSLQEH